MAEPRRGGWRRSNGEGTVTKRRRKRPDGTMEVIGWVAALSLPDGGRRYFYGATAEVVREKLAEARKERDGGVRDSGRNTMNQLFDVWLADLEARVARGDRALNTLTTYRVAIEHYLRPAFGKTLCRKLSVRQVESYLAHLDLAPRTRSNYRLILRRGMGLAKRWGWVATNVVADSEPIPVPRRVVAAISPADATRLLAVLAADEFYPVYVLALYAGLRIGEILGLDWQHIDFAQQTLRVEQQIQHDPTRGLVITALKTEASRATLDMLPEVAAALQAHWQACGRPAGGLVFQSAEGRPQYRSLVADHFQRTLRRAGLPVIRLHDLRHYFVSFMPALGVHPEVTRRLARHTDIRTTMNVYTGENAALQKEAAARLHEALAAVAVVSAVVTTEQTLRKEG